MAEPELHLYVWENTLCDYSCGIVVVYARDLEHAVELLSEHERAPSIRHGGFDFTSYRKVEAPEAFVVTGGG